MIWYLFKTFLNNHLQNIKVSRQLEAVFLDIAISPYLALTLLYDTFTINFANDKKSFCKSPC